MEIHSRPSATKAAPRDKYQYAFGLAPTNDWASGRTPLGEKIRAPRTPNAMAIRRLTREPAVRDDLSWISSFAVLRDIKLPLHN
jgi:hypothetical protein